MEMERSLDEDDNIEILRKHAKWGFNSIFHFNYFLYGFFCTACVWDNYWNKVWVEFMSYITFVDLADKCLRWTIFSQICMFGGLGFMGISISITNSQVIYSEVFLMCFS